MQFLRHLLRYSSTINTFDGEGTCVVAFPRSSWETLWAGVRKGMAGNQLAVRSAENIQVGDVLEVPHDLSRRLGL